MCLLISIFSTNLLFICEFICLLPIKKTKSVSIETKKAVIDVAENGTTNQSELSRRFNISRGCVQKIIHAKQSINNVLDDGMNIKRARLRSPKHDDNLFLHDDNKL